MKKYILLFLLVSCSSSRLSIGTIFLESTIIYDKVKLSYSDNFNKVILRGKVTISKDSLIKFKFFGPLGVEAVSGKFVTILELQSQFTDSLSEKISSKLYDTFGFQLERKMVENLLLFNSLKLYEQLVVTCPSTISVGLSHSGFNKSVITLVDHNRKSSSMITFVTKERFPLEIYMEYVRDDYFLKLKMDVYSLQK